MTGIRVAAIAAGAVIGVAGGAAAYAYLGTARLGDVSPKPGGYANRPAPRIVIGVDNASRLDRWSVLVDGRSVTDHASRRGDSLVVEGLELADGSHTVRVIAHRSGPLFSGDLSKRWTFTIDTQAPRLSLSGLPRGYLTTNTLALSGRAEPGAEVTARAGSVNTAATAAADGSFALSLAVPDGIHPLWVTATDLAGNAAQRYRVLRVDASPPAISLTAPDQTSRRFPRIDADVAEFSGYSLTATLDNRPFALGARPAQPLAEGLHRLVVEAVDVAGNRSRAAARILVDSTEKLGRAVLIRGARGADVRALQRTLKSSGFYRGRATGLLDGRTARAVKAFQASHGMPVDGVVGTDTLGALTTRIVIDQSDHMLTLYRAGKKPLQFGVAVGQAAYPTPIGDFYIVTKVVDPTWVPPNSDWARNALPIPPGPDNPLGTRWMGLSAPAVGIHGTPDPASIGYSVSHGCIRMRIPEVERLFELVYVGTSVTIQA